MSQVQVPIRKLLWDALELTIETQAKRLARDIADALGQDSSPLLKSIRDEKVSVYLFDEQGDDNIDLSEHRCEHLITIPGQDCYLTPCCNPAVWLPSNTSQTDHKACLTHSLTPSQHGIFRQGCKKRAKLKRWNEYYIQEENGAAYNQSGTLVGKFCSIKNVLEIFEVDLISD
jgi:hypothetical protein